MKFYKWYTQALGCIAAMLSCVYCYLRGDLLLYYNLYNNYDYLGLNRVVASYTLYPLCILTFFLILLLGLVPQYKEKRVLNFKMIKINSFLKYLLIVIGILGCGIYFIVPTLVLLLGDFISFLTVVIPKKEKHENHDHKEKKHKLFKKNKKINTKENTIEAKLDYLEHPQEQPSEQLIKTKNEIALHLLEKNSDLNFISDITGFSIDYIKKIKEEAIFDHNKNSTI